MIRRVSLDKGRGGSRYIVKVFYAKLSDKNLARGIVGEKGRPTGNHCTFLGASCF